MKAADDHIVAFPLGSGGDFSDFAENDPVESPAESETPEDEAKGQQEIIQEQIGHRDHPERESRG